LIKFATKHRGLTELPCLITNKTMDKQIYYKCGIEEEGEVWEVHPENVGFYFQTFEVVSITPKGVWIMDTIKAKKRFILNGSMFTFAYPTKLKALRAFYTKKKKHIQYMRRNVEVMEIAIGLMKDVDDGAVNDADLERILAPKGE